jgi:hypothetical protein
VRVSGAVRECTGRAPGRVHVGAVVDEELDDLGVAARAGGVEREDAVDDRVGGLTVGEGVGDEAEVAGARGPVEAEVGDYMRTGL